MGPVNTARPKNGSKSLLHVQINYNKFVFANKAVFLIWRLQKTASSSSIRVGTQIIRKTQTVKRDPR